MATVGKVILILRWICFSLRLHGWGLLPPRYIFVQADAAARGLLRNGGNPLRVVGLPAVPISIIVLSSDGLTAGDARSHHLTPSIKKTKIAN